ncbi:type I-F CRISPR-associated protein Csy1 [Formicincola oecophyllae]|nr:type I-F CRISPR-associated protein Csy1 [Formicincola oecophyllae]
MSDVPSTVPQTRQGFFEQAINAFLQKEREKKPKAPPGKFNKAPWLAAAARQAPHLTMATHLPKATHTDSKATPLVMASVTEGSRPEIGTHSLRTSDVMDAAGATALPVWNFLNTPVEGLEPLKPYWHYLRAGDADAIAALSPDASKALAYAQAFKSVVTGQGEGRIFRSDAMAKQLFWPVAPQEGQLDVCDDSHFILLQPLHSSLVAQAVDDAWQAMRFSAENVEARKARKEGKASDYKERFFPDEAIRVVGSREKPQNVSSLNSKRRARGVMLSCAPTDLGQRYDRHAINPKYHSTVIDRLMMREAVRQPLMQLVQHYTNNPQNNMDFRNKWDALVDAIGSAFLAEAATLRSSLKPGWSADKNCALNKEEELWLDPGRCQFDEGFKKNYDQGGWMDVIASRFSRALTDSLKTVFIRAERLDLASSMDSAVYNVLARTLLLEGTWPTPLRRKSVEDRAADRAMYEENRRQHQDDAATPSAKQGVTP